ncbi:hypothetical protein BDV33DRAFT_112334 [Aspergillus novoparasiticus]|uniref:Secreted protein n=1 Tax=Aspergillus novoparasiticus TaxID=986946 RepID=A0A5N6F9F9_9EURO|nr:hypothetical protein BDV33DRAFT_112334 [Aspergillus novoparasiticus]
MHITWNFSVASILPVLPSLPTECAWWSTCFIAIDRVHTFLASRVHCHSRNPPTIVGVERSGQKKKNDGKLG